MNKLSNELQIPLNAYVTQFPDMKVNILLCHFIYLVEIGVSDVFHTRVSKYIILICVVTMSIFVYSFGYCLTLKQAMGGILPRAPISLKFANLQNRWKGDFFRHC